MRACVCVCVRACMLIASFITHSDYSVSTLCPLTPSHHHTSHITPLQIMQLCMGNHDLYMRRRRLDTMEVQQMKAQAKEERARKMAERDRLEREKQARLEAERRQLELEERLQELEEEARRANEERIQAQKIMELLSEKVKIAEEEAQAHARKKLEAEEEIRRVRASAVKVSSVTLLLFILQISI